MALKILELKAALGSGARANKYRLNFSVPATIPIASNLLWADALCKATTFPSVSIGQIEVWNQHHKTLIC